ncbi:MAG: TolC family protein [Desulfobacterales bacterium]|nr:TolC family protein [Desulfobacterales bacterium]MDD3951533.1 TolC family protein [Desulfobacterales bacterium]
MIKASSFPIVVCLLLTCIGAAAHADPLTLEQCIERGLSQNPEVKAYTLAIDEADQEINEAKGAFLPTLGFNYNLSQLSNGNSNEIDSDYLDQDSDSFSVRLTQPLFTGLGGVAGLKKARQSKRFRQYELQYVQLKLVHEIRTSFYDWIHARQRAEQWRESVRRLEQQSAIAAAWVEQRLAPRLRLLEIGVELSNARHELIRTCSEEAIAEARLREWLAAAPDEPLEISGSLDCPMTDLCVNLEDCQAQAMEKRPEIVLAQLNIDMARQEAKSILARNLPHAQIDASWVDFNRDYNELEYSDLDRDYYSVGLSLSFSPFQGGRNLSAWRRTRIAVDRLEQRLVHQRNSILTEVETGFQQLAESRARILNSEDTLNEARAAYQMASRSAELGVVSLNELLDAELRLTRAGITLINSHYALCQAQVQMDFALGNFTAVK